MQTVATKDSSQAIGPYSQAVVVDGFVFTSGAVGLTPQNERVGEDVVAQAEQTLKNLTAVLAAAGCTLADVVKAQVFLTDMGDFAQVNEVYARHFGEHRPARSCVEVRRLPADMKVEIDLVARQPRHGAE